MTAKTPGPPCQRGHAPTLRYPPGPDRRHGRCVECVAEDKAAWLASLTIDERAAYWARQAETTRRCRERRGARMEGTTDRAGERVRYVDADGRTRAGHLVRLDGERATVRYVPGAGKPEAEATGATHDPAGRTANSWRALGEGTRR